MKTSGKAPTSWHIACITAIATSLLALATYAQATPMIFVMQVFPPFSVDQNGHAEGPFPDTIRAVCAFMKAVCRLETYPWRRALRMAEQGDVDGIIVIQNLPERERHFYLTDPIVQSAYGLFANQAAQITYNTPKDLETYTVGVYGPSATSQAAEDIARAAPSLKISMEVDNATVLRKLSARRYGELAAAIMNIDVAHYLIKRDNIADIKLVGEIKKIEYLIGLSRKKMSAQQAEQFNAALRELRRNGAIKTIVEKYGMKPVTP